MLLNIKCFVTLVLSALVLGCSATDTYTQLPQDGTVVEGVDLYHASKVVSMTPTQMANDPDQNVGTLKTKLGAFWNSRYPNQVNLVLSNELEPKDYGDLEVRIGSTFHRIESMRMPARFYGVHKVYADYFINDIVYYPIGLTLFDQILGEKGVTLKLNTEDSFEQAGLSGMTNQSGIELAKYKLIEFRSRLKEVSNQI